MTDETTTTTPEAPAGFRRVRFSAPDTPETIHEGILRIGAETWSGGLMPFVSVETARAIAAEWQAAFPTPQAAHAEGVDWFDVEQTFTTYEFVFYPVTLGKPREPVHYDPANYADGYPLDSGAWGTSNLMDDADYAAKHPGDEWIDLGSLGFVWYEADPPRPEYDAAGIGEEAMQAAFGVICNRLGEQLGRHVSGDISPAEAVELDAAFRGYVEMMARNAI